MKYDASEYIKYHVESSKRTDIDPQVEALQFICDKEKLSLEQRFWLCFLFSTCYCVGTAWLIFTRFPEFRFARSRDVRLWYTQNRQNLLFQTDRVYVKSVDRFCGMIDSYADYVSKMSSRFSQREAICASIAGGKTATQRYDLLVERFDVSNFSRFSLFLYSDLLNNVCSVPVGVRFNILEAQSSRNGLALAIGREDLYTGRKSNRIRESLSSSEKSDLIDGLNQVVQELSALEIKPRHKTLWSIETCLCAYRKWKEDGRRWVGYYVERYAKELKKLSQLNPNANMSVLYGFCNSLR